MSETEEVQQQFSEEETIVLDSTKYDFDLLVDDSIETVKFRLKLYQDIAVYGVKAVKFLYENEFKIRSLDSEISRLSERLSILEILELNNSQQPPEEVEPEPEPRPKREVPEPELEHAMYPMPYIDALPYHNGSPYDEMENKRRKYAAYPNTAYWSAVEHGYNSGYMPEAMHDSPTQPSPPKPLWNHNNDNQQSRPPHRGKFTRTIWTAEMDAKLTEAISIHGLKNWVAVEQHCNFNIQRGYYKIRWDNHVNPDRKKDYVSGPLSNEETLVLKEFLKNHSETGQTWKSIANIMNRTYSDISYRANLLKQSQKYES